MAVPGPGTILVSVPVRFCFCLFVVNLSFLRRRNSTEEMPPSDCL